jgi:hypothetical protein
MSALNIFKIENKYFLYYNNIINRKRGKKDESGSAASYAGRA